MHRTDDVVFVLQFYMMSLIVQSVVVLTMMIMMMIRMLICSEIPQKYPLLPL